MSYEESFSFSPAMQFVYQHKFMILEHWTGQDIWCATGFDQPHYLTLLCSLLSADPSSTMTYMYSWCSRWVSLVNRKVSVQTNTCPPFWSRIAFRCTTLCLLCSARQHVWGPRGLNAVGHADALAAKTHTTRSKMYNASTPSFHFTPRVACSAWNWGHLTASQ